MVHDEFLARMHDQEDGFWEKNINEDNRKIKNTLLKKEFDYIYIIIMLTLMLKIVYP